MKILKCLLILFTLLSTGCDKNPPNIIINAGFENALSKGSQSVWKTSSHAGEVSYNFDVDSNVSYSGKNSFKIVQFKDQVYGIVQQLVPLAESDDNEFEFSAMLRTRDIQQGNGSKLVINCLTADGYIIKQFKSEALLGNNEWTKLTIKEVLPKRTATLNAGIMLQSQGTVWIDEVNLIVK